MNCCSKTKSCQYRDRKTYCRLKQFVPHN